jgi:hypothetical protein
MSWQKGYGLSIALAVFFTGILPSFALEINPPTKTDSIQTIEEQFTNFPCGLNLDKRQLLPSMIVRGKEDGSKAIDFANWSIPFNTLTQTLKIQTKILENGNIELRSNSAISIISRQKLNSYPGIGLAIKTKDLEKYLGIKAEFDLNEYAINLTLPKAISDGGRVTKDDPLVFDGLATKKPENFNLTAIEQKVNLNTSNNSSQSQGQTKIAGTIWGASWYASLGSRSNRWLDLSLNDAQVVKYSDQSDYIIGGQSAFWNRQNGGNYWGATGIWRQGFTPSLSNNGIVSANERTQSNQVGRSIVGMAAPGTVVKLLPISSDRAIAEVLVGTSGVFRFDNIPVTSSDRYYRLWLFANGQLSAAPEVREANFVTVPGQLPTGTTATLASVGLRRTAGGLIGQFSDLRGAIITRQGVSESLTLGAGVSLDQGIQGLGELYFQPNGIPLKSSISVRTGAEIELLSNINWRPARNVEFDWNSDRLSQRLRGEWQVSSQLSLNSTYDSQDATSIGFDYLASGFNDATTIQASFDTQSRLKWRLTQQLGAWELQNQGNEVGTISRLTYAFDRQPDLGSLLQLNYQTSQLNPANEFSTLSWRYRPTNRSPWEIELGYGLGRAGGGWLASGAANILPGINLRGRYQNGISSNSPSFSLELVSNLETQGGWRENPQQLDKFRTFGGIEIRPFFDLNDNGQQDAGEKSYLDLDLINLNNRPIKPYRPLVGDDRISLKIAPGKYRLDFDPAGLPPNWRVKAAGYAVEVAAGSYTKVLVPLTPSYTITGMVRNRQGRPIAGAKVELIPIQDSNASAQVISDRVFSITSRDGQFYLESLSQGRYQLQVNDKPLLNDAKASIINLDSVSPVTQNLTINSD